MIPLRPSRFPLQDSLKHTKKITPCGSDKGEERLVRGRERKTDSCVGAEKKMKGI